MLVIGTGGLASDILTTLSNELNLEDIVLYNDIDNIDTLYYKDHFKILTSKEQAKDYFKTTDNRFILAIGDNMLREKMTHEFIALGGNNASYISPNAYIGKTAQISTNGVFIMQHTNVSMNSVIEDGCIIYLASGIGHNSLIKKYNMISSGVIMSNVTIGEYSTVGIGAKFKPGINLGKNCLVGIGSVITKSFDDNAIIFGNPAILKA